MKLLYTPTVSINPFSLVDSGDMFPVVLNRKDIGYLQTIRDGIYVPYDSSGRTIEVTDKDNGFNMSTATNLVILQYLNQEGI